MSKVLTFSMFYPAYHPRAGQPTGFVEKLWAGWAEVGYTWSNLHIDQLAVEIGIDAKHVLECEPKCHTIRAGHRWKVGDRFSPRVWSGKAYRSKQVIIGPDIEVKKIWDIEKHYDFFMINGKGLLEREVPVLAKNDGLEEIDLRHWFGKAPKFIGQIICWNEDIEYLSTTHKPETL